MYEKFSNKKLEMRTRRYLEGALEESQTWWYYTERSTHWRPLLGTSERFDTHCKLAGSALLCNKILCFRGKFILKKKTQYIPKTKSSKIPTKENRFPNLLIKQPQILDGDKEFPDPKTQQNLREKNKLISCRFSNLYDDDYYYY